MTAFADRRILDLFGIELPILQAPMAGFSTPAMAVAVSEAGGLGGLACAQLGPAQVRDALTEIREGTSAPINVNFFCHPVPKADPVRAMQWRTALAPYYVEHGLDPEAKPPAGGRAPFDEDFCAVVEEARPEVVSFHFGLPDAKLVARVKAAGCKVISSATTVAEARWLEARGCDAIIAMGLEAGGHRGVFLFEGDDPAAAIPTQVGLFALLPQVADAVSVPVIAAGGIADARGIVAAMTLGASAVQLGTAYLFSPEANVRPAHLAALQVAADDSTAVTNVFTGRPARGIANRLVREVGPLSPLAPAFPMAAPAVIPLKGVGTADFLDMWSGQAAALCRPEPAGRLTARLAAEAATLISAPPGECRDPDRMAPPSVR